MTTARALINVWGPVETRAELTRQIIKMLGLDGKKATEMRKHLDDCGLSMVLNFRDSLLGRTAGLFPTPEPECAPSPRQPED